jgi:hypothetical protein
MIVWGRDRGRWIAESSVCATGPARRHRWVRARGDMEIWCPMGTYVRGSTSTGRLAGAVALGSRRQRRSCRSRWIQPRSLDPEFSPEDKFKKILDNAFNKRMAPECNHRQIQPMKIGPRAFTPQNLRHTTPRLPLNVICASCNFAAIIF